LFNPNPTLNPKNNKNIKNKDKNIKNKNKNKNHSKTIIP
jgi:hypothetical protein